MKERSDDAILVFPLLCPPPSCHNMEFQKKEKDVGESSMLPPAGNPVQLIIFRNSWLSEMRYDLENIMKTVNNTGK